MRPVLALVALIALALPAPARTAAPDPAVLAQGSEIAYRRALTAETAKKTLNADAAATQRLRRITSRLVGPAAAVAPDARGFHWEVNVRADSAADVRAYPGGRLLISDGLVTRAPMKDDEVAAIVAHAIAHLLLGHDVARLAASAPAHSADPNREALAWADAIGEAVKRPRYSAEEIEAADRASAELVARAAFDPRALGSAWRQLARDNGGIVLAAPVSDSRLAAIDAAARAAVPLYEEAVARAASAPQGVRPPAGSPPRAGPPAR